MTQRQPRRGTSTPLPSVKLELGKFVSVRKRQDGTCRVLFEVPPRLRPSGWLATVPLPRTPPRTGNLTDAGEVARIQADAKALYADYLAARLGRQVHRPEDQLTTLIRHRQSSQDFKRCHWRTQKGYAWAAQQIVSNHALLLDPFDWATMTRADCEHFLAIFDNRPTSRLKVRNEMRALFDQAKALRWRDDHPMDGVKVAIPKGKATIWEPEDIDLYVWGALLHGQPSVAAIILTEWEIGQRLTDAVLFRRGAEYEPSQRVFRFWQSKTNSYVTIPVSERLGAILEHIAQPGSPYLFHDAGTGRPFRDVNRLGHVFEDIRDRLVLPNTPDIPDPLRPSDRHSRYRVLRYIRHSCVVQLARAVCTVPEIASITGHKLSSVNSILSHYLPADNQVAWNAQAKRGLIGG